MFVLPVGRLGRFLIGRDPLAASISHSNLGTRPQNIVRRVQCVRNPGQASDGADDLDARSADTRRLRLSLGSNWASRPARCGPPGFERLHVVVVSKSASWTEGMAAWVSAPDLPGLNVALNHSAAPQPSVREHTIVPLLSDTGPPRGIGSSLLASHCQRGQAARALPGYGSGERPPGVLAPILTHGSQLCGSAIKTSASSASWNQPSSNYRPSRPTPEACSKSWSGWQRKSARRAARRMKVPSRSW